MNDKKITIVTATYNAADTLEQTILSVLNQTYDNVEYIIIDGASTDGTVDIIKKYSDRLGYWCSEKDKGIYDAFNKGIRHATGDYIQFLGADDSLYEKDALTKVAAQLEDDVDILSTCGYLVNEELKIERLLDNHDAASGQTKINGSMAPHPGMFVKLPLMRKYMFDESLKIVADYKFFLTCYLRTDARFKDVDTPTFYFSDGGTTGSANPQADKANMQLWQEFGLNWCVDRENRLKSRKKSDGMLKTAKYYCLKKMGILVAYKCRNGKWRRHKCDNALCRWCTKR